MSKINLNSFREFWQVYVLAHQNRKNQIFHFAATLASIVLGILFILLREYWILLFIPIVSYGLAWVGHLKHEKNTPLTWSYPVYSLIADYKMFFMLCFGKMKAEILKAQSAALISSKD